jgi:oligopeptide/dipeptide ABC transporter ATP-binding protein
LLEVNDLVKHFGTKSGLLGGPSTLVRAVEHVSFSIATGETLGLVGESGSGKSTTGRLILRLIEATSGSCSFYGRNVFTLSHRTMRTLRREMQIVFQDPYGAFNPRMSVGRIIGEALELRGISSRSERAAEVQRLLTLVQLPGDVGNRFPHEFSGGQRQRIGIARALAVEPKFLVADEPVSALDVSTQAEIVNLLLDLQKRLGLTMLFISHDLSVVRILADRIAVMYAGRILELAPTDALFVHPLQPYTQELLAAIPEPDYNKAHRETRVQIDATADLSTPSDTGCPFAGRCPHAQDVCRWRMPALVDYSARLGESSPHWAACHLAAYQLGIPDSPGADEFKGAGEARA